MKNVLDRRTWLKKVGLSCGATLTAATALPERAEATGAELIAVNMLNPETRKMIGRYKKVLLGSLSTLLSTAAVGAAKLDEMTDIILGAEFGKISDKEAKDREKADGGHWKYASPLLPYQNTCFSPQQSIRKDFSLEFKRFLTTVPNVTIQGFNPAFADFNERECLYSLTLESRETIGKLASDPIFPCYRRHPVSERDPQDNPLVINALNEIKSDELKLLIQKEYRLAYVRSVHAGDKLVLGLGFDHNSKQPGKDIFWVEGFSSCDALKRTVLLDRLLANALG